VTGGHVQNGWGLPDASIYDPFANAWTRLADMNNGRWYPTNTTLANGEVLVLSGSTDANYSNNSLPQVWTGNGWRNLTSAVLDTDLYPGMHLAPNGKVFMAVPAQTTRYLDAAGTGAWSTVGQRKFGYRGYGASVLYDTGKVLAVGGADPPTNTAEVIDLTATTPAWRQVGSMASARRQINATILADGKVLVTGGSSAAGFDQRRAPCSSRRCGTRPPSSSPGWPATSATAAITRPPFCCRTGGSFPRAATTSPTPRSIRRPTSSRERVRRSVRRPRAWASARPSSWGRRRPRASRTSTGSASGSVTHANNMDQRINRLGFAQASGGLNITAPSDANLSPPGYYMLFLLNSSGVPSVAKIVRIGTTAPPPTPAPAVPGSLSATAVSRSQINLAWTDNANNEDGFHIERSTDNVTFAQVASVGANTTTYANTGLRRNTTYYYRVRAYNGGGNSAYSNIASATTLGR
jgi:hypothetical protein